MKHYRYIFNCIIVMFSIAAAPVFAQEEAVIAVDQTQSYTIGIDDMLDINILQPEPLLVSAIVAPDGNINFPYIGEVEAQGKTLAELQELIQRKLSEGYMRYPVVSVTLKESKSRKFFVYGEVVKPGTYQLDERTTVLKAISIAGGLSKFGSANRVKVLRERRESSGYETIKVNLKAVMDGASDEDVLLQAGDIVVVSEGVF